MTYATYSLAEYAAQVKLENLPSEVVSSAKACILDCIACMAGGSTTVPGRWVMDLVVGMGGRPDATVVGSRTRLPAPYAAYVNGFLANVCDMDDNYFGMGHPGSSVVPTALALGESRHLNGADLIAAVVAGYEVGIRVGRSMLSPAFSQRQKVKGQSTWLMFGAIAAASRLMAFDLQQAAIAFGVAATNASVPFLGKIGYTDRPMSTIKNNFGWTCMGAILAVESTRRGFVGTTSILDGDDGFWRMAGAGQCDWGKSLNTLGKTYEIPLIQFKRYPSCYGTHPVIEGLVRAMAKLYVTGDQVEKVLVRGASKLLDYEDHDPGTLTDSQFSIPYVVAMILLGKAPGPEWWDEGNLRNPLVLEQANKVTILPAPSMEGTFQDGLIRAEVTVYTRDGRAASGVGQTPLPEGDKGLDVDERRQKFEALTTPVAGPAGAQQILKTLGRLETLQDVADLMAPLRGPSTA